MIITQRPGKLPVIQTVNLVLRDITAKDVTEAYVDWLNAPEVNAFLEVRFHPQTMESVLGYVRAKLKSYEYSAHFGVYDQDGSRLVGTVTMPEINHRHRFADLSFVIGLLDAQGCGYATEAVNGVLFYAFRMLGLNKVWGGYYDGHLASQRVFEKNGFTVEGKMRRMLLKDDGQWVDQIFTGLLTKEYTPRQELLGDIPIEFQTARPFE